MQISTKTSPNIITRTARSCLPFALAIPIGLGALTAQQYFMPLIMLLALITGIGLTVIASRRRQVAVTTRTEVWQALSSYKHSGRTVLIFAVTASDTGVTSRREYFQDALPQLWQGAQIEPPMDTIPDPPWSVELKMDVHN